MNLDKLIFEMYEDVMFSIENNLFEERLSSKESFRRAIALWKNLPQAKKEVEAKRILKAAKREGYIVKQKEILAYADKIEDYSKLKAKKSVRRELRAKKKAKRDERFEQVKASVEDSNLEDKTRIELLAIAIKKGLKTTPKMNRADLIDLIRPTKKEEVNSKQDEQKEILEHKEKYKDKLNFTDEFGKPQGIFRTYFDDAKRKIRQEAYYIDGKLNGEYKEYYEPNILMKIATYKDSKLNGKQTRYGYDGSINTMANYKDGELDGEYIDYYNGKVDKKGVYKDGKFFEDLPEIDEDERKEIERKLVNVSISKDEYVSSGLRKKFGAYGDENFKKNFPKYMEKVYSNYLKIGTKWKSVDGEKTITDIELHPRGDMYIVSREDGNTYKYSVDEDIEKVIKGDIFATTSEGKKQAEYEQKKYEERLEDIKRAEERQKKYEQELEDETNKLKAKLSGYLKGKTDLQKGKIIKHLSKPINDKAVNKSFTISEWIEDLLKRNYVPRKVEMDKSELMSSTQWNRLNYDQQREAMNTKITEYTMYNAEKKSSYDVGKTEYDLAVWLKEQ